MLTGVVIAIVGLPALLTFVWFSEVGAGYFALRKGRASSVAAPGKLSHSTTVLIPAHNEGAGILPTIRDVQAQLGPNDRILVVADNCTDDTAAIVQAVGAEVTVRADPARRGKGYALEFGVRHLRLNPPDVVVIMDADCRLGGNALRHLSDSAMASGRPVQSLYLMLAPENAPPGSGPNLFAWRVKNWIRPLGMELLGLPTQLVGTGMAFPLGLLLDRDLQSLRYSRAHHKAPNSADWLPISFQAGQIPTRTGRNRVLQNSSRASDDVAEESRAGNYRSSSGQQRLSSISGSRTAANFSRALVTRHRTTRRNFAH